MPASFMSFSVMNFPPTHISDSEIFWVIRFIDLRTKTSWKWLLAVALKWLGYYTWFYPEYWLRGTRIKGNLKTPQKIKHIKYGPGHVCQPSRILVQTSLLELKKQLRLVTIIPFINNFFGKFSRTITLRLHHAKNPFSHIRHWQRCAEGSNRIRSHRRWCAARIAGKGQSPRSRRRHESSINLRGARKNQPSGWKG